MSNEIDLSSVSEEDLIEEVESRGIQDRLEIESEPEEIEVENHPDYNKLKSIADKLKTGRNSEALEDIKELIYEEIGVIL